MARYGRLMTHLLEEDVVTQAQLHRPELAPVAWLQQAHTSAYVEAAPGLTLDPAAARRIGLPITADVVRRARAASAGTAIRSASEISVTKL
jgi:acetoin utilization deacetylase AcuC-like enzyme